MKILINAQGSRGDVRPMLVLCKELCRAGHNVFFCASKSHLEEAARAGGVFFPLGPDVEKMLGEKKGEMKNPLDSMKTVIKGVRGSIFYYVDHLLPIIEEVGGIDLFVGGGVDFTGFTVAEFLKVRYVYVAYFPQMFRSAYYPPVSLPLRGLPRTGNRALWAIESWLIHHTIGLLKIYNLKRKEMGLPPIRDIMRSMTASAILAADRALISFPPDVPGHDQTGSLHEPDPTALSDCVTEFLQVGEPPVYIGFGSMEITDPEKTERILLEVIRRSDQRFIVSDRLIREGVSLPEKASIQGQTALPENLLLTGYVSYDLLFPHLAAVVHHGGAGTTQLAARYGLPQLILPKAFDQFYWAGRIRALGLGPRGFPMGRLSFKKLSPALSELTRNPGFKENADRVREQIPKHDGNRLTVEYLLGQQGI